MLLVNADDGSSHRGVSARNPPATPLSGCPWFAWGSLSRLARSPTTILTDISLPETIDTTGTHCFLGLNGDRIAFAAPHPFRLDELPKFRRHVLEVPRQPFEKIVI
jgi:hypothetical protein